MLTQGTLPDSIPSSACSCWESWRLRPLNSIMYAHLVEWNALFAAVVRRCTKGSWNTKIWPDTTRFINMLHSIYYIQCIYIYNIAIVPLSTGAMTPSNNRTVLSRTWTKHRKIMRATCYDYHQWIAKGQGLLPKYFGIAEPLWVSKFGIYSSQKCSSIPRGSSYKMLQVFCDIGDVKKKIQVESNAYFWILNESPPLSWEFPLHPTFHGASRRWHPAVSQQASITIQSMSAAAVFRWRTKTIQNMSKYVAFSCFFKIVKQWKHVRTRILCCYGTMALRFVLVRTQPILWQLHGSLQAIPVLYGDAQVRWLVALCSSCSFKIHSRRRGFHHSVYSVSEQS